LRRYIIMAEERPFCQQQQIQPGQCPPEGCPPFDRIECIVVDKVYDSCFQVEDLTTGEFEFDFGGPDEGDLLDCELKKVDCQVVRRTPAGGNFFTLLLLITVTIKVSNPDDPCRKTEREIKFTKTVTLCCPDGVDPNCDESTLTNCTCVVVDDRNGLEVAVCDLQLCLVIKCILKVQLLVPSYGFCIPAPCVTLPGVCPPLPPEQCF
jgi:hypothetical protein